MLNSEIFAERQNKQGYAYETLKEMIISNQLPAETNLVERQICEMLNLSRTPVRAALQELEKDNLVINYPGKGMVVSKIQIEDFIEIFELRGALDSLALSLFMRYSQKDIIIKMRETVDNMKNYLEKEDFTSFVRCDNEFHECYFFNTGNRRLNRIMKMISDQVRRILNYTVSDKERCAKTYNDHVKMIDAIEAGDVDSAVELVKAHISDSLEYHIKRVTRR